MAFSKLPLGKAPLAIIDGDRGENYPQKSEFASGGFCLFLNTSNVTSAGFAFGDLDFITTEKDSKLRKGKLQRHDVVLTTRGTVGNCAYFGDRIDFEHIRINSGMVILRADPERLNPYFLYSFLRSNIFKTQIGTHSSGSAQPQLPINSLINIVLPFFGIAEQRSIAAVLSTLDAKIELNNRINAELEGMAKLLYDYWFVQFDFPMTAAQAAALGKPHLTGHPYRASGGKMIYNETLKREIPEGWGHSTIGETFKTHLGGTPSRQNDQYWNPGEVNWLSSGENPSTFVLAPDEKISKLGLLNSPAKLLPAGTVVLSIVRHLRASILGIEAATNQSVVGILETPSFKHCFIYPYIVREIPRLMVLRTGAQQPHINKGVLGESPLVIPDEPTLDAYTKLTSPLFSQIKNNQQQNQELTQLRDWLLPMLMNGQVTVGANER